MMNETLKLYRWPLQGCCWIFMLLCFLSVGLPSFSQKIAVSADRNKIVIGEQIELKVTVSAPDKHIADQLQWFDLPDSFNHFEIVKRFPIDTILTDGAYTFIQKIIITSFDSGYWYIPALKVTAGNALQGDSIPVSVLPADVSNLKEYHDFKDIVEVKAETDWWLIAEITGAVLVFIVVVILIFRYFKNRKPRKKKTDAVYGILEVLKQIDELDQKDLIAAGKHKLYFSELIQICRTFSDHQLQVSSSNKTTDEYMLLLKNRVGNEPVQISYFQLLRLADAVKFAKYIPAREDCQQAIQDAKSFVQTIYEFQFIKKS